MSATAMPRDWTLNIVKFIGFTLLVTAAVAFIAPSLPASSDYVDLAVFFLITLIIGGLSWTVMPPLGKRTANMPFPVRWTILVSALLGTGTLGAAISSAIGYYGFGVERGA